MITIDDGNLSKIKKKFISMVKILHLFVSIKKHTHLCYFLRCHQASIKLPLTPTKWEQNSIKAK